MANLLLTCKTSLSNTTNWFQRWTLNLSDAERGKKNSSILGFGMRISAYHNLMTNISPGSNKDTGSALIRNNTRSKAHLEITTRSGNCFKQTFYSIQLKSLINLPLMVNGNPKPFWDTINMHATTGSNQRTVLLIPPSKKEAIQILLHCAAILDTQKSSPLRLPSLDYS